MSDENTKKSKKKPNNATEGIKSLNGLQNQGIKFFHGFLVNDTIGGPKIVTKYDEDYKNRYKNHFDTRKITICYDRTTNNIGFSVCSPNEDFSNGKSIKKQGLIKSYGRVLAANSYANRYYKDNVVYRKKIFDLNGNIATLVGNICDNGVILYSENDIIDSLWKFVRSKEIYNHVQ